MWLRSATLAWSIHMYAGPVRLTSLGGVENHGRRIRSHATGKHAGVGNGSTAVSAHNLASSLSTGTRRCLTLTR